MNFKGIALGMYCSFLSLVIHIIINYFRRGRLLGEPLIFELERQAKLLLAIWLFAFLIYIVLFFRPPEKINILINKLNNLNEVLGFIYGIIFYLCLSFIYLTLYYLVDRSVSATILEIIDSAPQKKLTLDEIKKIYNVERKYQIELKGMLEGRFVIKQGDYYKNSLKGYCYAIFVRFMKSFLKLGRGG